MQRISGVKFNRANSEFIMDGDFFDIIAVFEQERQEQIERQFRESSMVMKRLST